MQPTTSLRKILLISLLIFLIVGQTEPISAGILVWTSIGPEGGLVQAVAIDPATPTTLYAGTYGSGVFKSTNGGESGSPVNTGLSNTNVRSLVIDPLTPTTLYAGTGGGVFKSTNSGESWSAFNPGLPDTRIGALAIDPLTPTSLYAGTDGNGVFAIQQIPAELEINYSTGAAANCEYAQKKCAFKTIITSRALCQKINCQHVEGMVYLEDVMQTVTIFDKLKAALRELLGPAVRIDIELGATSGAAPAEIVAQQRAVRQAEAEAAIMDDPFVQTLVRDFDATVSHIKPIGEQTQ